MSNYISSIDNNKKTSTKKLSVLLVSDFFYPKVGGVEVHIYQLAVSLVRLGCRVSILTHHRDNRQGVHIMGNGIKVYFHPMVTIYDDTAAPVCFATFNKLRHIIVSDSIDIVHCHQSASSTSLECLMHASILGVRTVMTEHSLYGFGQLSEVNLNKVIRCNMCNVDQFISVSNLATENLMFRAMIDANKLNTIPNGIDNTEFRPLYWKDENDDNSNIFVFPSKNTNMFQLNIKELDNKKNDNNDNNDNNNKINKIDDEDNKDNIIEKKDLNISEYKNNKNITNNVNISNKLELKNILLYPLKLGKSTSEYNEPPTNRRNSVASVVRHYSSKDLKSPKLDSPIITIVSVSRQTYRKGTDLLIEVIPEVCKLFPNVNFLIGGDGPKKKLLDKMVEVLNLKERVFLAGSLAHSQVAEFMSRGQIYLNTSLTESFCMAIVEAASSGLFTIATDVGGVGEVLPPEMVKLVKPSKESIIEGIKYTLNNFDRIKQCMKSNYKLLKKAYGWHNISIKTLKVYEKAMNNEDISYRNKIRRAWNVGGLSGVLTLGLILIDVLFLIIFSFFQPIKKETKKEFKYDNYIKYLKLRKRKLSDDYKKCINKRKLSYI